MANRLLHILCIAATCALAAPAFADGIEGPNPADVKINRFAHGGDGCPQGTLAAILADDAQAITVIFDEFIVEAMGNGRPAEAVKDCLVMMGLKAPAGWAYSLVSLQLRGYAKLDKGTTALQSVRYRFGTPKMTEISKFNLAGEFDDNYFNAYDLPIQNLDWSSCENTDKPLFINTRIGVRTNGRASALMTVDSLDGQINQEYGIIWKPCSGPKVATAVCRAEFVPADRPNKIRQVMGHARGATDQEALSRAQARAMDKCNLKAARGAGACRLPAANACQMVKI